MLRRTFLKSLFGAAVAVPAAAVKSESAPTRPLVLQQSPLAGFQYHQGEALWSSLNPGDPLELVREPDNPRDRRAVAVHWHGHKLGYIPRIDNCAAAQLLDRGQSVTARIVELNLSKNPWQRMTLEISTRTAGNEG